MKAPRESDLVLACLKLLRLRGCRAWRQNVGAARYRRADGTSRMVSYGCPGMSDIMGILPAGGLPQAGGPHQAGRALFVECKMPGRKLTDDQRAFLVNVQRAGALGLVVRSLEELEAFLEAEGY